VRRLTGDENLTPEFATTWRTYDLDANTMSLLEYAEKLTKAPGMIEDGDIDALRASGWSEEAIYEASALISFFNFSGRMEAASGLAPDEVPADARPPEARDPSGAPRRGILARLWR
jgi:alkylhydroperoxidase family enzyme